MSSSIPSPPTGKAAQQVAPSGDGHSRETARWTSKFAAEPTQPSFVAHTQLSAIKYHRCTLREAREYESDGHRIWEEATDRLWRPFPTMLSTRGSTHDPNAFYSQLEEVQKGERALEEAGQSASHEESFAAGASEDGQVADKDSDVASSESASGPSVGVFDKPEVA